MEIAIETLIGSLTYLQELLSMLCKNVYKLLISYYHYKMVQLNG